MPVPQPAPEHGGLSGVDELIDEGNDPAVRLSAQPADLLEDNLLLQGRDGVRADLALDLEDSLLQILASYPCRVWVRPQGACDGADHQVGEATVVRVIR